MTKINDVKQGKTKGNPHRWKRGESGNPDGRPRQPEIELLREALEKVEKDNNKTFIQHFVELAFTDKNVAIALAKKLIPDKLEGTGFEAKQTLIQIIKTYKEDKIDSNLVGTRTTIGEPSSP